MSYTATAATQIVEQEDDKKAVFFHVAYTEDGADPASRPIVFAFNGGPGSSTVWLHLGLLGPRRVEFDESGFKVSVPGRLIHNDQSILDVADVVLVDAIGTGFSTATPKDKEKEFHHFSKDIGAFTDFIVSYLNRNGRWASPKYVAGESYGTTRGAAIAHSLFAHKGTELNGLILISAALNFQTIGQEPDALVFRPGNDLPFMVFLPTYAATAWFHGRLSSKLQRRDLRDLLDEVEEFAIGAYWSALARGDALEDTERKRVMAKLAAYTGLSADYIDRYNLRIHIHRFCKELMRDQRRTVGRLDSRFTGIDRIAAGDNLENDPASRPDRRAVHGNAERLPAGRARIRERVVLRDPEHEGQRVLGLRRVQGSLRRHLGAASGCHVPIAAVASVRGQRVLRPGHAPLRHRLHDQPSRSRRVTCGRTSGPSTTRRAT